MVIPRDLIISHCCLGRSVNNKLWYSQGRPVRSSCDCPSLSESVSVGVFFLHAVTLILKHF